MLKTSFRLQWYRLASLHTLLLASLSFGVSSLEFAAIQPARAIDRATVDLLTLPLEPALFQPGQPVLKPDVITPDRISQTSLTPPSLWWVQEQIANLQWTDNPSSTGCLAEQYSQELLSYWLAYSGSDGTPRRVDLLVNQQIWTTCNYLQRYTFINRFGTAAKAFGYNTRVFNAQGELLGAYICQFQTATTPENTNAACGVFLNSYGRGAFSGNSTTPFGASSPTGAGTPRN
jgi:hypothetical protein